MSGFMTSCTVGKIFSPCEVIEESDRHFYLHDTNYTSSVFDIVLPKYEKDEGQYLQLDLKVGDFVKVKVYTIHIAHDGRPGAFVELVEKCVDDMPELISDSDIPELISDSDSDSDSDSEEDN